MIFHPIINPRKTTMTTPTTIRSSSGGTITYTKTGLIHRSGGAYSGKIAALEKPVNSAKK
jgi:hypothetical protein|tara:strand:+ start:208 stop:387 length:180 start_codon:yes stop_codon:yes gene_type:complete